MWIETPDGITWTARTLVSPASNGGCGLKRHDGLHFGSLLGVSPASNGGCGLKRAASGLLCNHDAFHPPVMAGVD